MVAIVRLKNHAWFIILIKKIWGKSVIASKLKIEQILDIKKIQNE